MPYEHNQTEKIKQELSSVPLVIYVGYKWYITDMKMEPSMVGICPDQTGKAVLKT